MTKIGIKKKGEEREEKERKKRLERRDRSENSRERRECRGEEERHICWSRDVGSEE